MAKRSIFLRQGDVGIRLNFSGKKGEEIKNRTVAYGESSGHLHRVDGGRVFNSDGGVMIAEIPKGETGALRHTYKDQTVTAEHPPILIPAGEHAVVIQREHNYYAQAAQQVRD